MRMPVHSGNTTKRRPARELLSMKRGICCSAYRVVDAAASRGPGGDVVAAAISENSGAGSIFGYGIRKGVEAGVGSIMRPTINSSGWASVGKWSGPSGLRLFTPDNMPAIGSSIGGSVGYEFGAAEINGVRNRESGKQRCDRYFSWYMHSPFQCWEWQR